MPSSITDYYMSISCEKYPFLEYDSFVNCSTLKTSTVKKILAGGKSGEILQEDLDMIIGAVCESPNESKMNLKRFGLI